MFYKIAWLAIAGAAGTISRYGLTRLIQKSNGTSLPWETMLVNLAGCFIAGLLLILFEQRWSWSGEARVLVIIGFIGSFTTFSSLILETNDLFNSGGWIHAAANLLIHNGMGIVILLAGIRVGRMIAHFWDHV